MSSTTTGGVGKARTAGILAADAKARAVAKVLSVCLLSRPHPPAPKRQTEEGELVRESSQQCFRASVVVRGVAPSQEPLLKLRLGEYDCSRIPFNVLGIRQAPRLDRFDTDAWFRGHISLNSRIPCAP